jgi:hypothetical protein
MAKLSRIKGNVTKTNVLKRNPDYKAVLKLWEFLRSYDDIGYSIRVVEQNPEINEKFQQDIYHNILFNYLILKGYLEDEADRELPEKAKGRNRTLKPKFIHQIVEELTEDYDLPDVEVRKVLIEELTKAQLMQEEAAERRRLVEEQEARKKAEEERIKAEKKAEQERIRAEKAAERERIRQEKEAEAQRLKQERMEREAEDRRRSKIFQAELTYFQENLEAQLEKRRQAAEQAQKIAEQEDYADAVQTLEEEEKRRREERERERKRKQEEKEQQLLAEEQARQEELRRQQAQAEAEARAAEEQRQKDLEQLKPYITEITYFTNQLPQRMEQRRRYTQRLQQEKKAREESILERRKKRKLLR